jgi:hypothetical protein
LRHPDPDHAGRGGKTISQTQETPILALAPGLLLKILMTMRPITVAWLLVAGFAIALGCSSQGTSGHDNGGGGAGGAASDAGLADDSGGKASDARFACGDASCSVAQEYCRDLGGLAGASGANDGAASGFTHYLSCVPFDPCAARDCSCAPKGGAYYCATCSRQDGGGILAICGSI